MNTITIGFSRPSKLWPLPLFAWVIMLFDWSRFSHSYVRFQLDGFDREMIFQASGLRVNFMPWAKFRDMEVIVKEFDIPVSTETKKAIIQYTLDEVGTPYAIWAAVIGIPIVKLFALFGKKIKNPINQMGDWCSEVCALILKDYDGIPFTEDQVRRMTPKDVYNYLNSHLG